MSNNFAKIGGGINLGNLVSDPSGANPGDFYYNTTFNKIRFYNGTVWHNVGSGSGSGTGINFLTNGDFEDGVIIPWVAFANAAAATPPNNNTAGTGGSPVSTFTINPSSPLSGTYDGLFAKDNVNRQGEGFSIDYPIDEARKNALLQIDFDYKASANFVGGMNSDLRVFLLDKDAGVLTPIDVNYIGAGNGHFTSKFLARNNSLNFRLIFYIATTNTNPWTFEIDNVDIGLPSPSYVSGSGDRQIMDPVSGGSGTVGNGAQFGTLTFVAKATARYVIHAWAGLGPNSGQNPYLQILDVSGVPGTSPQTVYGFAFAGSSPYRQSTDAHFYVDLVQGNTYSFNIQVYNFGGGLIVQETHLWGEQIGPDKTPGAATSKVRLSTFLANGTNVIATPTKLGEYRTIIRSAATTTVGVDDAPGTPPSAVNGMQIFASPYLTGGTAGQTQKWVCFIGYNKSVRYLFYPSAGRVGEINTDIMVASGDALGIGVSKNYNPETGLLVIDTLFTESATEGTKYLGLSVTDDLSAPNNVSTGYWDVEISDNPMVIGFGVPAIVKSNSVGTYWQPGLGGAYYPLLDTLTNPLSVQVLCNGGDIEIGLMDDGSGTEGYVAIDDRDHLFATGVIKFKRDGVEISRQNMFNQNNIGIHEMSVPPNSFRFIDSSPPPGIHTYTVEMSQSGTSAANNTGVAQSLLYARPMA